MKKKKKVNGKKTKKGEKEKKNFLKGNRRQNHRGAKGNRGAAGRAGGRRPQHCPVGAACGTCCGRGTPRGRGGGGGGGKGRISVSLPAGAGTPAAALRSTCHRFPPARSIRGRGASPGAGTRLPRLPGQQAEAPAGSRVSPRHESGGGTCFSDPLPHAVTPPTPSRACPPIPALAGKENTFLSPVPLILGF